jgi:hypothetical protein
MWIRWDWVSLIPKQVKIFSSFFFNSIQSMCIIGIIEQELRGLNKLHVGRKEVDRKRTPTKLRQHAERPKKRWNFELSLNLLTVTESCCPSTNQSNCTLSDYYVGLDLGNRVRDTSSARYVTCVFCTSLLDIPWDICHLCGLYMS